MVAVLLDPGPQEPQLQRRKLGQSHLEGSVKGHEKAFVGQASSEQEEVHLEHT